MHYPRDILAQTMDDYAEYATFFARSSNGSGNYILVYILFLVAGLLVGGVWSAYKAGNKLFAVILALCAVIAAAGGVLWALDFLGG
ncbi:hypothetical protein FQV43_06710 [Corynebacterium sp. sy039]|nr:hypothetical protein FQV43_06710 [Corynebacterium sp. sy039]